MITTIDIRDLPARLEEALALTAEGGEVLLTDGAAPRARLVPCGGSGPRIAGLHVGAIQLAPDFDAPLPERVRSAVEPEAERGVVALPPAM